MESTMSLQVHMASAAPTSAQPGGDEGQANNALPVMSLGEYLSEPSRLLMCVPPGCYFAWIFLVCFTPIMFGDEQSRFSLYAAQLVASLVGYLLVLLYRILGNGFDTPFSRVRVLAIGAVASMATAGIMAMRLLGSTGLPVIVAVAAFSFVAGAALALNHVYWVAIYASEDPRCAPCIVGGFLLLSCAIAFIGVVLPLVAAFVLIALLPLVAAIAVEKLGREGSSLVDVGFERPTTKNAYRLPAGFLFGIVVMGLVYGLAQDFSLVYASSGSAIAIDCFVVNAVVGLIVVAYAQKTGKNFGYSSLCLAIVPIAGLAQGMIAVFRTDLLPLSFAVMRFAYMLFDAMLWLQLPRVFERIRSIRVFLLVRLAFEGSMLVAVGLHRLLMFVPDFQAFNWVALTCLALLLAALTWAFASDSVGTVWNLMPTRVPYTGKFRRACKSIEDEYGLTPRESEVLELVLRGRSGPYIEEKLFISKNTFQTHMRNVYNKMDIHSQQDLLDLLEQRMDEHRLQERR